MCSTLPLVSSARAQPGHNETETEQRSADKATLDLKGVSLAGQEEGVAYGVRSVGRQRTPSYYRTAMPYYARQATLLCLIVLSLLLTRVALSSQY